ncbi:MAG: hypothetical protein IKH59_01830 [Bacteroidaceae bacterium]|nr:hypothetical protein [Bacteroidaceae bacterium]
MKEKESQKNYTTQNAFEDIKKAERALVFLKREIKYDAGDEYTEEILKHIEGPIKPYKALVERVKAKERLEKYLDYKMRKEDERFEGIPSMEDL